MNTNVHGKYYFSYIAGVLFRLHKTGASNPLIAIFLPPSVGNSGLAISRRSLYSTQAACFAVSFGRFASEIRLAPDDATERPPLQTYQVRADT